ncbi:MAG: hypothetical protein Q9213_007818 [Squamulea squamosa]
MSVISLPTSRAYLSSIFESFPEDSHRDLVEPEGTSNSLISGPPAVKSLLLTLHVLFPNELLPALDLLDRKLVTRLYFDTFSAQDSHLPSQGITGTERNEQPMPPAGTVNRKGKGIRTVYYVRSSQQPRFRFSTASSRTYDALAGNGQSYEVRLKAWNCSCPAFALAGVACLGDQLDEGMALHDSEALEGPMGGSEVNDDGSMGESGGFGGLMRGEGEIPVCKHLLACYLAESWKGFEGYVGERIVSREEMSGWAAGWGG